MVTTERSRRRSNRASESAECRAVVSALVVLGSLTTLVALTAPTASAQHRGGNWSSNGSGDSGGGGGSLRWSGDVDDTATIYLSGRDVRVSANQNGVRNEDHDVRGELPRANARIQLRGDRGDGDVRLVQQPSRENGYTAAVRVHDPEPGRHHYSFVLQWAGNNWGSSNGRGNNRWNNGNRWNNRDNQNNHNDRPWWKNGNG